MIIFIYFLNKNFLWCHFLNSFWIFHLCFNILFHLFWISIIIVIIIITNEYFLINIFFEQISWKKIDLLFLVNFFQYLEIYGMNYFFSIFTYPEPAGSLVHYLYNNQFDGEYLLPEFKHLDFLWLMKGDVISEETVQAMIQSVRQINGVQLVMELSQDKIKNKGHLIF